MRIIQKIRQFLKARRDRAIKRNLKTLKNPKALKDDRDYAIDYFVALDDPSVVVPALLARFDYSLEHGINDTREKEKCLAALVELGPDITPTVIAHLQATTRIAWPIKLLRELCDEDDLTRVFESLLDYGDIAIEPHKVEKNYDLLCYLRDYPLPDDLVSRIAFFLGAADERVRYAAAEAIIEQRNPVFATYLEELIFDSNPDNTRVRETVLQAYVEQGWRVGESLRQRASELGGGLRMLDDGTLEVGGGA